MAEYNINKFSYGGNTYKLEDNRIKGSSTGTVISTELLNIFYPIGTVYETTLDPETFDPNDYWGGQWERIEGRFLVGKGTSTTDTSASDRLVIGANDTTGGYTAPQNSKHSHGVGTLSTSEQDLSHTHTLNNHTHSLSNHTHGTGDGEYFEAHTSSTSGANIGRRTMGSGGSYYTWSAGKAGVLTSFAHTSGPSNNTSGGSNVASGAMSGNSKHTHTISGSTAEVSAVSAGNLPPWYAVYIWQRMA